MFVECLQGEGASFENSSKHEGQRRREQRRGGGGRWTGTRRRDGTRQLQNVTRHQVSFFDEDHDLHIVTSSRFSLPDPASLLALAQPRDGFSLRRLPYYTLIRHISGVSGGAATITLQMAERLFPA